MTGNSSRHGGKQRGSSADADKAALRKKADKLVATTGIPRHWAYQIAQGRATLNQVLTRLARQDRIDQLERRYELDRSTAAQVVDGSQTLEQVMLRRRLAEHREEHGERSVFDEYLASGQSLVLHVHGLRTLSVRIAGVDPYELDLDTEAGRERMHKLQVKFAHAADVTPKVGQPAGGRQATEPRPRPQDRFHCSDRRLFAWLDLKTPLRLSTLEGDQVEGKLDWIARWELGLRQKGGLVVVMKHALAGIEEI